MMVSLLLLEIPVTAPANLQTSRYLGIGFSFHFSLCFCQPFYPLIHTCAYASDAVNNYKILDVPQLLKSKNTAGK